MNDRDERAQLEVRLTALLLGEASEFEAAELRRVMDADPELAAYYERIEKTIEVVREASGGQLAEGPAVGPRLSRERRTAVMARLTAGKRSGFLSGILQKPLPGWVGVAAVFVVLGGLIASMSIPAFNKVRATSQDKAIDNNLRQYASAAQQFMIDEGVTEVSHDDIVGGNKHISVLESVAGESYENLTIRYGDESVSVKNDVGEEISYHFGSLNRKLNPVPPSRSAVAPQGNAVVLNAFEVDGERVSASKSAIPEIAVNNAVANFEGGDYGLFAQNGEPFEQTLDQMGEDLSAWQSLPIDPNRVERLSATGISVDVRGVESAGCVTVGGLNEDSAEQKTQSEMDYERREPDGYNANDKSEFYNKALNVGENYPELGSGNGQHSRELRSEIAKIADLVGGDTNHKLYGRNAGRGFSSITGDEVAKSGATGRTQSDMRLAVRDLERESGRDNLEVSPDNGFGMPNGENIRVDDLGMIASNDEESSQGLARGPAGRYAEAKKQDDRYRGNEEVQSKEALDQDVGRKAPARRYDPLPEIDPAVEPYSTFSLNVSDVSFRLADAALAGGVMPSPEDIRSEEFLNAFNYHDPAPTGGVPLAFHWERARSPFHHNREFLRFSVQTASEGRERSRPLNLVLLIDNSGSMERADRRSTVRAAVAVLGGAMREGDRISVVAFDRAPHLVLDGISGEFQSSLTGAVNGLNASGATHLESGLDLAYEVARTHFHSGAVNRVVLLTDGAANLGEVLPERLRTKVVSNRKLGIALDCFGIGADGLNDAMLEALSRNGDGRYGFLNSAEDVDDGFSRKLAGSLRVAASDVKVQVIFNAGRVAAYRQIGYRRHQLTGADFRNDSVDAAEIGGAEAGNALYVVAQKQNGVGPIATVRVRFRDPATREVRELSWTVPASREAPDLREADPALRLAVGTTMFAEWLAESPYAEAVTPGRILENLIGVPEAFPMDGEPMRLREMIETAAAIAGR